jgi:hypothetical protein
MKFLTILIIFLLMNAFLIISNNQLALKEPENIPKLKNLYLDWVKNLGKNMVQLSGEVIKLDWITEK